MKYYFSEDKSVRLYNGDCLEVMDMLIEKGIKVDAIITDPPYGMLKFKWDSVIPLNSMWEKIYKLSYPSTPVCLFGSEPFSSSLRMSNIKNYKYDWIWQKTRPSLFQHANKRPMKDHELISVFYKKQCKYNPSLKKLDKPIKSGRKNKMGTILEQGCKNENNMQYFTGYPRQIVNFSMHNHNLLHPTQKPVALMEYLVKTYTDEGDLVLDFTAGSMSTVIACLNTKRKCIAIELDDNYFNIGCDRVKQHISNNTKTLLREGED